MIEIVFNESAAGSLKVAQSYGKGSYHGGAVSVFIMKKDGSELTEAEKEAAIEEAKEQERLAWEQASPLGGISSDVFCFAYALSMGDISEDVPGEKRREMLKLLTEDYPDAERLAERILAIGNHNLASVIKRSEAQEPMRIWYSDMPDELCGMYWFMTQIGKVCNHGPIYLVKLPDWEVGHHGEAVQKSGWGELAPEEWHRYVPSQREATDSFVKACSEIWYRLQKENSPLRVALSGRLVSMPENLYDNFILRELEQEEDEFSEAKLIGKLLGKYQLGISDEWYALRIDEMIRQGSLEAVNEAPKNGPRYRRTLRKRV